MWPVKESGEDSDRRRRMIEVQVSCYMLDYFNRLGFEFTDFQKATLIWNIPCKPWCEILDTLKKLADITTDERVKTQVFERVSFEEKKFKKFEDNTQKEYVYVVVDREDNSGCGFFSVYDIALEYAKKYANEYETRCLIQKQKIVQKAEDQIVRNAWSGNPNLGLELEEYEEYSGNPVAEILLNANGDIVTIESYELSKDDEELVSEYRTNRFEFPFIKIPFDMSVGTVARDISTGKYYVLAQGKEDWDKYLKRIEERNLFVDFSDVQVVVYSITENGCWSHDHINPLYLEPGSPEWEEDNRKHNAMRRALENLGDYLSNKSCGRSVSGDAVIASSLDYAEKSLNREARLERILNAMTVEDILF